MSPPRHPQLLGVYVNKDAADRAALDPYYRRLGAQVADVTTWTPVPGKNWGLIIPPVEKTNGSSKKAP